jgi:hypothetical protein
MSSAVPACDEQISVVVWELLALNAAVLLRLQLRN